MPLQIKLRSFMRDVKATQTESCETPRHPSKDAARMKKNLEKLKRDKPEGYNAFCVKEAANN